MTVLKVDQVLHLFAIRHYKIYHSLINLQGFYLYTSRDINCRIFGGEVVKFHGFRSTSGYLGSVGCLAIIRRFIL